jgi:hypothetical protein
MQEDGQEPNMALRLLLLDAAFALAQRPSRSQENQKRQCPHLESLKLLQTLRTLVVRSFGQLVALVVPAAPHMWHL